MAIVIKQSEKSFNVSIDQLKQSKYFVDLFDVCGENDQVDLSGIKQDIEPFIKFIQGKVPEITDLAKQFELESLLECSKYQTFLVEQLWYYPIAPDHLRDDILFELKKRFNYALPLHFYRLSEFEDPLAFYSHWKSENLKKRWFEGECFDYNIQVYQPSGYNFFYVNSVNDDDDTVNDDDEAIHFGVPNIELLVYVFNTRYYKYRIKISFDLLTIRETSIVDGVKCTTRTRQNSKNEWYTLERTKKPWEETKQNLREFEPPQCDDPANCYDLNEIFENEVVEHDESEEESDIDPNDYDLPQDDDSPDDQPEDEPDNDDSSETQGVLRVCYGVPDDMKDWLK